MLGTYASFIAVMGAAAAVGQALLVLCGRRGWSWLAPPVGLALLCAIAWWAVRLPGEGAAGLAVLAVVTLCALAYLRGRAPGLKRAARLGLPVVALALLAASLPFIVEGRFGILGTGLNPDMSQHLFAADRLADGGSERLIAEGYPLGPHAVVVALAAGGPSPVQAFDGLTLATAVAAVLVPLALLRRLPVERRIAGALLIGLAYMTASYLVQGAFKETMQALFVLAFAVGLGQLERGRLAGAGPWRAVPLAVLAAGSVYVYSFPGLLWLGGAAVVWAALELVVIARRSSPDAARGVVRAAAPTALWALGAFAVLVAPELGRVVDFASFETFDPAGAGLGNLFNPISPLEALGIWPSGDFRLDPGDGAAPAAIYYLGAVVALAALAYGLAWWWRRGDRATPAALAVALALVAYANLAGTPYQEAKAIALAAPLAALIAVRALAAAAPRATEVRGILRRAGMAALFPRSANAARRKLAVAALAVVFALAAGGSSLLALANGPVGPVQYSPTLTELRPLEGATLVLAPEDVLADEHGRDYLVWELRGGRVCVEARDDYGPETALPGGITQVITFGPAETEPPFAGASTGREVGPYTIWEVSQPLHGALECPFISDGERADPDAG